MKISLTRAIREWAEWLEDTTSPNLAMSHTARIESWFKTQPIKKLPIKDACQWKSINNYLKKKAGEGIKYETIKQHIASFRSFLKFIYGQGWLPNNPGPLIKIRPQILHVDQLEANPKIPFTFDEYRKILCYVHLQATKAPQAVTRNWAQFWRISVPLAYWCGIRLMDCCTLTLGNFRPEGMVFWTKKRNKRVFLPFDDKLIGHPDLIAVRDYVCRRHQGNHGGMRHLTGIETPVQFLSRINGDGTTPLQIQNGIISEMSRMHVFPNKANLINEKGRTQFSTRFKRILDPLKIKGKSFHCFRHSFATRHGLEPGKTFEDVAKLLGHSNTKTTEGYYHG